MICLVSSPSLFSHAFLMFNILIVSPYLSSPYSIFLRDFPNTQIAGAQTTEVAGWKGQLQPLNPRSLV